MVLGDLQLSGQLDEVWVLGLEELQEFQASLLDEIVVLGAVFDGLAVKDSQGLG